MERWSLKRGGHQGKVVTVERWAFLEVGAVERWAL